MELTAAMHCFKVNIVIHQFDTHRLHMKYSVAEAPGGTYVCRCHVNIRL
jgi:hypothetical protein